MGGKKRSRDVEENDYKGILKKIRKLEKQVKEKKSRRRRRLISSSSEDDSPINSSVSVSDYNSDIEHVDNYLPASNDSQEQCTENENIIEESCDLNDDVLNLLGEDPSKEKTFGDNLHKDIAPRWNHILLNGVSKETRLELLKTYLPPENCTSMKAPKLNPEIKAALTDISNKKDAYSQSKQNQLACTLSALGKALNFALSKENNIQQEMIKYLSDVGKLLCDYHHKETQSRRYAVINTLNKQTRETIKNTKVDEFLFGKDLAEHLKSSKAISKSGQELRPSTTENRPKAKPTTAANLSAASRGALNARGAPRAEAAETRANPAPRRQTTRDRYTNPTPRTTHHRHRGRRH